jgi:Tol biopolymer transport system component
MDSNGSNIRQLTPAELEGWIPDWSPDGESIALSTHLVYPPNTETSEIRTIKVDGTGLRQLTEPGLSFDDRPSWSPQENAIAFERDNATFTSFAIEVINTDGSGHAQMFQGSGRTQFPPIRRGSAQHRSKGRQSRAIESGGLFPRWGPAPN